MEFKKSEDENTDNQCGFNPLRENNEERTYTVAKIKFVDHQPREEDREPNTIYISERDIDEVCQRVVDPKL